MHHMLLSSYEGEFILLVLGIGQRRHTMLRINQNYLISKLISIEIDRERLFLHQNSRFIQVFDTLSYNGFSKPCMLILICFEVLIRANNLLMAKRKV